MNAEIKEAIENKNSIAVIVITEDDESTNIKVFGKKNTDREHVEEIIIEFTTDLLQKRIKDKLPF